jgi:hypothetical protein
MSFHHPTFITLCLVLSAIRIYLEIIKFNFNRLPITASLPEEQRVKIHRTGLYISIGYIILFAPEILLS